MATVKKEALYWTSCLLYGVVLTGLLLYLRFPTEKFRSFCESYIEDRSQSSFSIGRIGYRFPATVVFMDVRLTDQKDDKVVFFEDARFSFQPVWHSFFRRFAIESDAFAGTHNALLSIDAESNSLVFSDVHIDRLDLAKIGFLGEKLERKLSGVLEMKGSARLNQDSFDVLSAQGSLSISGGEFALKKPILELDTILLTESSVNFNVDETKAELIEGSLKNAQLVCSFSGNISFTTPWWGSAMEMRGEIVPQAPLFQEKKQLRAIVSQMQRRLKKTALPFLVNGTVGSPSFTFEN